MRASHPCSNAKYPTTDTRYTCTSNFEFKVLGKQSKTLTQISEIRSGFLHCVLVCVSVGAELFLFSEEFAAKSKKIGVRAGLAGAGAGVAGGD